MIEKPIFIGEDLNSSKDTEQADLCFGYDGLTIYDERYSSLAVLNNVLGGSMSSRLFQDVRENKGLAYAVFSGHSSHLDSGMLTIYAGTGKDSLESLKSTIESTIDMLIKDGVTDKELKNSKEQIKGQMMLSLENTSRRMMRNGRNELLLGKHRSLEDIITDINSVTHDSVKLLND